MIMMYFGELCDDLIFSGDEDVDVKDVFKEFG